MTSDRPNGDTPALDATEQVARLAEEVQRLRERLDRVESAQEQLRRLVDRDHQPFNGQPAPSAWQRWRDERRGLGASLVITGIVVGIAGVLLHLALRTQTIDTTVHLGYLIGLTGVLLFLVGLFIVF
jgi:hypothetical protein